jgi:hypothetical protein
MTADVCDLDELKSGLREKVFLAQFIGGWSSLVLL